MTLQPFFDQGLRSTASRNHYLTPADRIDRSSGTPAHLAALQIPGRLGGQDATRLGDPQPLICGILRRPRHRIVA